MDHQPIDGSIYKTNTLRIQLHPTERITYTKQKKPTQWGWDWNPKKILLLF